MHEYDLTHGSILGNLIRFSLPYLLSCFLQTFYGLADLVIVGRFNGSATIAAVAVGSQATHMLTLIIAGLAMGSTVTISRAVGAGDRERAGKAIGSTVLLFIGVAAVLTVVLLLCLGGVLSVLSVPAEAWADARVYLLICFAGVPFITAYNVISSIFRGLGDTRRPMYFVAVAGVLNVGLDLLLIGPFHMGAAGAAFATIIAQAVSVALFLLYIRLKMPGFLPEVRVFRLHRGVLGRILRVGLPVAAQDGLIQIAFRGITGIANRRGVSIAASVGIVEKLIGFMFLVPSAMLSAVSAISAQNLGAGRPERARKTLLCGMALSVGAGIFFTVLCQLDAAGIIALFAGGDPEVVVFGSQYLRAYVFDCAIAGIHFCYSGYFCACQRSLLSFAHNLASIILMRIPGAYLASLWYPDTLFPMGLAAPLGSLLSAVICFAADAVIRRRSKDPFPDRL